MWSSPRTSSASALEAFIARVDLAVRRGGDPLQLVRTLRAPLADLLAEPGWLEPRFQKPRVDRPYSQYLLFAAPDDLWSVIAFVWPPGVTSPIHDHCTWGLVGVQQGVEIDTTFRRVERSPCPLVADGRREMRPGDIGWFLPPDDIHQVVNGGEVDAISIHIYGANIGKHPRHIFDPASGAVTPFVSGYDEPPLSFPAIG